MHESISGKYFNSFPIVCQKGGLDNIHKQVNVNSILLRDQANYVAMTPN
jgi:hypothetical protein